MTDEERRDLAQEERIARVLRARPRDVSVPSFAAVEARLRRRAPLPLVLATTATVLVVALVIGNALAERRAATPAATSTPAASAVATLSTTSAASPPPSPTATAPASVLSDRFGFVWVEEPTGLRIRPETGGSMSTLPALPYSFSRCGCTVSPDGARIAYWTTRTAPDNVELRVVDLARPTEPRTIYKAPAGQRISAGAWSSDGAGILFATEGTSPPGTPPGGPPSPALHVIEADGGAARTLDRNAGAYVPLGWDRGAGIAAAALSGEGGYMTGYLTVRTGGDPTAKRTIMSEFTRDSIYVMSVDVSSDQRYALGVFFELGQTGGAVRWWRLYDFGAMDAGPRVDSPFAAKWRPGSAEIGWVAAATLQLHDVERGTTRASGRFPAANFGIAAFRQDGSAVAGSDGPTTVVLEIASGRSEKIAGSGHIAGAVRLDTLASPPTGTPPPLIPIEQRIVDALALIGVKGQRAENPGPDSASMWVPLPGGSATSIVASRLGTNRGEFSILDERFVGAIRVQRVRYTTDAPDTFRSRFACSAYEYRVWGAVPPGFPDMTAFVDRLISSLDCVPGPL